jgi:hypothetical protein
LVGIKILSPLVPLSNTIIKLPVFNIFERGLRPLSLTLPSPAIDNYELTPIYPAGEGTGVRYKMKNQMQTEPKPALFDINKYEVLHFTRTLIPIFIQNLRSCFLFHSLAIINQQVQASIIVNGKEQAREDYGSERRISRYLESGQRLR